jgi:hypothetical protein
MAKVPAERCSGVFKPDKRGSAHQDGGQVVVQVAALDRTEAARQHSSASRLERERERQALLLLSCCGHRWTLAAVVV